MKIYNDINALWADQAKTIAERAADFHRRPQIELTVAERDAVDALIKDDCFVATDWPAGRIIARVVDAINQVRA